MGEIITQPSQFRGKNRTRARQIVSGGSCGFVENDEARPRYNSPYRFFLTIPRFQKEDSAPEAPRTDPNSHRERQIRPKFFWCPRKVAPKPVTSFFVIRPLPLLSV